MIATAVAAVALRVSVAPERVRVRPGEQSVLTVRAPGAAGAEVDVGTAGYDLDATGRPEVRDGAPTWLRVAERRLLVGPRGITHVHVTANVPSTAIAGDHAFLVLLSFADRRASGSRILVRVGVVVTVRVPGRVVHRLELAQAMLVRGGGGGGARIRLVVLNRGNVEEWLGRGRLSVTLAAGGVTLATLRSPPRRVLANSRAVFELVLPRTSREPTEAGVRLGRQVAFRLRL